MFIKANREIFLIYIPYKRYVSFTRGKRVLRKIDGKRKGGIKPLVK